MNKRADSVRVAHPLFQEEGRGSIPTSALQLNFAECNIRIAQDLNRQWHSVLPKTIYGNLKRNRRSVAFSAVYCDIYYAVAIWTDPCAANRMTNGDKLLELRRFAISGDSPTNTASRMLSWMRKRVKHMFPELVGLVSYQDTASHVGTIYKASGWSASESTCSLTKWNVNGRVRNAEQSTSRKVRWEWAF